MNHSFGSIQPQNVHRAYKYMFQKNLSPFLDMMTSLRPEMELNKWIDMVARISYRVIANPEQYVGKNMPCAEITTMIIQEVFEEFVEMNAVTDAAITA